MRQTGLKPGQTIRRESHNMHCEMTSDGTFDTTLRNACNAPATFDVYSLETLDIEHHVCTEHVSQVARTFGTTLRPGVDAETVKAQLGLG